MSQLNRGHATRVMYIESKSAGATTPARIGRVTFSKSGRTIYYRGRAFRSLAGQGFKANYFDVETQEPFWISGPRSDGADRLYASAEAVFVDEDARDEYWSKIRRLPQRRNDATT